MGDEAQAMKSRHVAIAGTGRAGTSFLVKYLTALGLDTTLSRSPKSADWNETANAGLEENLVEGDAARLPYYVKSPWLFAWIDRVLSRRDIGLDGVIIPVRDLVEASTSRAVLERQAVHGAAPWMAEAELNWEMWGETPGGILYSLNPVDQARLLAVGFHKLIERLVAEEVPIIFLSFPRFVEDSSYLYRTLRPLLPSQISESQAAKVFPDLADATKVRVGLELGKRRSAYGIEERAIYQYPSQEDVDAFALRRELARVRKEIYKEKQLFNETKEVLERDRDRAVEEVRMLREQLRSVEWELETLGVESQKLRKLIEVIQQSTSWKITVPLRVVGSWIRLCLGRD